MEGGPLNYMRQDEVMRLMKEPLQDIQDEDKRWELAAKIAQLFNRYIDNQ